MAMLRAQHGQRPRDLRPRTRRTARPAAERICGTDGAELRGCRGPLGLRGDLHTPRVAQWLKVLAPQPGTTCS
eukprot:3089694-Pyramimonas_sp.AAC.1